MMANFNHVVHSIKEFKDIDAISIDELQSFLLVHDQKINQQNKEEQVSHTSTNRWADGHGRG